MWILEKVLRAGEGRLLRRFKGYADYINSIEDEYAEATDAELRAKTEQFKKRYADGEDTLDDLLPEAFATAREAAKRVLGQRHYDVQLMGAAALHSGNIAEMKTGEGKTLTGVPAAYLNALAGKGVHVITTNDYLAQRDAEWMGRIHKFLGLKVGVVLANQTPAEHRAAYECDITHGTNNEFGFDYLRDNMAWTKDDLVQREHFFAIVDEVDSILIDEARTPLIISGPVEESQRWYTEFARIARRLKKDSDYEVDLPKRQVAITERGVARIEDWIGVDNMYEAATTSLVQHLNNALKAKELFNKDKEYIVTDGEVLIVDEFTGRVLHGRRFNEGMHQAIEAKENVHIKEENQTLATVTLQNYFRMYDKLSGMTGTAQTEAGEFNKVYKVGVVTIPTNKPMIRKDHSDVIYKTELAKFEAVVEDILERHERGQPVLVGTTTVENSELLSELMRKRGVPHNVLNAKNHAREAEIIAQAGRKGAITVATNMAGRGTDILLGGNPEYLAASELRQRGIDEDNDEYAEAYQEAEDRWKKACDEEGDEVRAAGGLYVLGTERHEARRIDNQLRGRSGRQGDPGESRFYLSLGDELMKRFRGPAVQAIMERFNIPDDVPMESKMVSKQIKGAQGQIEQVNAETRKDVLKYDEVMNQQRKVIYAERRRILDGEDLHEQLREMVDDVVAGYIEAATGEGYAEDWDLEQLWTALKQIYPISVTIEDLADEVDGEDNLHAEFLVEQIKDDAQAAYDRREEELGAEAMRELERRVLLEVIDSKWREHLYEMDYLREGIHLRGYAQRDPAIEYQREGFDMFAAMMEGIKEQAVGAIFNLEVTVRTEEEAATAEAEAAESAAAEAEERRPKVEIESKGLSGRRSQQQQLQYSAPTIDGDAHLGGVDTEVEDSAPALGLGSGPSSPTAAGAKRPAAGQKVGSGPSRNAPCPCGSGKKYKRCHGAPGA